MTQALGAQAHTVPGLIAGFLRSLERFSTRPALFVKGQSFSYDALGAKAAQIAAAIHEVDDNSNPLVAILAHRSLTAYAGVLGTLWAGKGYVPLDPKMPLERLKRMLVQSKCDVMVAGIEGLQPLQGLLPLLERPLTILVPELTGEAKISPSPFPHRFVSADQPARTDYPPAIPRVSPDALAYLLFTSGSTGEPKGVPISHANVRSYVQHMCERFHVNEHDRFSQVFNLTFDLSVHDMFVCWERGACLYSVPETSLMAPAKFIKDHHLTMWFSVPSTIGLMAKMGLLKPQVFPSLRVSLFCGEPLPSAYASAWQEAAPDSVIENLYGPTETTIAITSYRWDPVISPSVCINGIVPIGWVFNDQRACVIDRERNTILIGEKGELCLSGSQVTRGYWDNPGKTAEQFIRLRSLGESVWYRTGDLVKQDQSGCLYYLGRLDDQVKIRGYRVELQEIECVLRKASGSEQVAAVAWPVREGIAEGVVAFICGGTQCDASAILGHCREALPKYMVPSRIHFLDAIPLNENGKLDRFKLIKILEGEGV